MRLSWVAVLLAELAVLALASGIEVSCPAREPNDGYARCHWRPLNLASARLSQHNTVYDLGHLVDEAEDFAAGVLAAGSSPSPAPSQTMVFSPTPSRERLW